MRAGVLILIRLGMPKSLAQGSAGVISSANDAVSS